MSQTNVSPAQKQTGGVSTTPLIPPWGLVLMSIISVQIGATFAKGLFDTAGTSGVVFLRTGLTGLLFMVLWRPNVRAHSWRALAFVVIYGANIAAMMLTFYAAIDRIPLGVAVAIAFSGPLSVAAFGSRRITDLMWVLLAGVGVLLLSPITNTDLDPTGVFLALGSAATWASFIFISKRICRVFDGNTALALGMCIAALFALPFGIQGAANVLASPSLILLSLIVALLSGAIPYRLEFQAIKILPSRVYSLFVSLEPMVATLVGWLILHEALREREILGILFVTIAAVATARSGSGSEIPPERLA